MAPLDRNKGLLSFADEAEADSQADEAAPKIKFLSAHDVDTTGRLSAKTVEGRSRTTVTEIPDFVDAGAAAPARTSAHRDAGSPPEPRKMHAALQAAAQRKKLSEDVEMQNDDKEPVEKKVKNKTKGKEPAAQMSEACVCSPACKGAVH